MRVWNGLEMITRFYPIWRGHGDYLRNKCLLHDLYPFGRGLSVEILLRFLDSRTGMLVDTLDCDLWLHEMRAWAVVEQRTSFFTSVFVLDSVERVADSPGSAINILGFVECMVDFPAVDVIGSVDPTVDFLGSAVDTLGSAADTLGSAVDTLDRDFWPLEVGSVDRTVDFLLHLLDLRTCSAGCTVDVLDSHLWLQEMEIGESCPNCPP